MEDHQQSARGSIEKAKAVQTIADQVCLQAKNAEIHAQNAMAYAETARAEANEITQIAESVTKAARAAAVLSLECTGEKTERNDDLEELLQRAKLQHIPPELVAKSERANVNLQKLDTSDPSSRHKVRRHSLGSESGIIIRNSIISSPISHTSVERKSHHENELKPICDSSGGLLDEYGSMATVWEDSIQNSTDIKPATWAEKKTIRKIQRKLKDLDVNCLEDVDDSDFVVQRDSASKERLVANTAVIFPENTHE